jgi:hypothetical protein
LLKVDEPSAGEISIGCVLEHHPLGVEKRILSGMDDDGAAELIGVPGLKCTSD